MEDPLFYVDDSPIHGKGLFARKYIGAGELVGILDDVCYAGECHITIPD
jgi:hypothetical protein